MFQSTKFKVILFMTVFTIFCATVTFFGIKYVNNMQTTEIEEKNDTVLPIDRYSSNLPDNSQLGIVPGDMYIDNNIELIPVVRNDVHAEYYQISGLKNKEIEKKINNDIKDVVEKKVKEINMLGKKNNIMSTVCANYSNVLSIVISGNGKDSLNYDLTTGEKLKFSDLFINNCDDIILNKIKERAKRNWLENQYYTGVFDDELNQYTYDQSGLDQYLLELIKTYTQKKDDIQFDIYDDYIEVFLGEEYFYLDMRDFYQYICIFKKYLTSESIFENGNLEKNKYCLINNIDMLHVEEYNDNLFLRVKFYAYGDSNGIIIDNYKNYINNNIKLLKQNAIEQPNTAKYLYSKISIDKTYNYQDKYNSLSSVIWNEAEYTMPKTEYLKNRQEMFKNIMLRLYIPYVEKYNPDKVKCNLINRIMYVYIDNQYGEIIELPIKDVFVEDYDYNSVIKEKIRYSLYEEMNDDEMRKKFEEIFGNDIFTKMLSDLDSMIEFDYNFELGGIELRYDLEYNILMAIEENIVYIRDCLDMSKMK